ncbi:hypothetical protein EDD21DRAFT_367798 [Dissophora ornata]|nr:hypothetical protein BGZ58_001893 [Dissophora ornata]KAI8603896.1 hypothetical protein EDD21DRAFT_367798 [Dissophora ornata]
MSDYTRQRIPSAADLEARANIDARLVQESGDHTVHGIPPFTVPRADGTLERPDNQANAPGTATARMMRRRQNEGLHSDQDGDGSYTNRKGYRDGHGSDNDHDGSQDKNRNSKGWGVGLAENQHGLAGQLKSGFTARTPLFRRVRRAVMTTPFGVLIAWYYDAVGVLIYRNDPRIKGYV